MITISALCMLLWSFYQRLSHKQGSVPMTARFTQKYALIWLAFITLVWIITGTWY